MCGINGIIQIQTQKTNAVHQMNAALSHRGPDDEGAYFDEGIALGQRRLSIIDLSERGHQPMLSADKRYVLVFNGEIYNYREIKQQLSYPFESKSDSEVILAAWQKWGKDCVNHFNGMFAFAVWDTKEKELFLVRDRLGIKPLYYYQDNQNFVFSSEIRALKSSGLFRAKLSRTGLIDYLRYQTVQAPNTILENVFMLEPGTSITVKQGQDALFFAKNRYWELGKNTNDVGALSYPEITKRVQETFIKAVQKRMVADVPFGAFLSGGIDSSIVVGVMAQLADKQIKTFNISFAEKEFSEAPYARMIAKKFNTNHHEIQLSPEEFLNNIPKALKSMDHPSGDGINTWMVSQATKEAGITMALSGLGGDEIFAGYPIFKRMHKLHHNQWIWQLPPILRKGVGNLIQKGKPGIAADKIAALLGLNSYNFADAYSISRLVIPDKQIAKLLRENSILAGTMSSEQINNQIIQPKTHFLSQVSMAELSTYTQNVLLRDADQMSMAHALEVRVPFLDYELVELLLGIPDKFKYPITPKKLLTDSFGDLLPSEIVNRPKMGFVFPWRHWLKNELFEFSDHHLKNLSKRGFLDEKAVLDLWKQFNQNNPKVTYAHIWPLVVLENWLSTNNIES
jgi:asparagine synthase (glutamine-hydrolysing)